MGAYAICSKLVREAAEEGGVYYSGILRRFLEVREAKVAVDDSGHVIAEYKRHALESKIGGKNIADWIRALAGNYAYNIEKFSIGDDAVTAGAALFIHVAGNIPDNPVLVAWSSGDYRFVRDNMPRVKIVDRDQAVELLAAKAASTSPIQHREVLMIVNNGDTFHGISDSTIINRSKVIDAFNSVSERSGAEIGEALLELAKVISESKNLPAEAVFESFRREVAKDTPEKSVLKSLWDGIVSVLGGVDKVLDLGVKLAPLWT